MRRGPGLRACAKRTPRRFLGKLRRLYKDRTPPRIEVPTAPLGDILYGMPRTLVVNLRRLVPFFLCALAGCGGREIGTSSASSCTDNSTIHANGTSWTCSDGCNTCSCRNGEIASTEVACLHGADGGTPANAGLDATTAAEAAVATTDVDANDSAGGASGDAKPDAGVDAALPPSCTPGGQGMTNCGPGGSGTESCCTSLEVTGGTFYRTYDVDSNGNPILAADGGPTGEADPATVSGFRLDKYLVTVGRFRQFVNAWNGGAGWLPPPGSGKHTYLNNGNGLVATGGGYEPGWVATDDSNVWPTNYKGVSYDPPTSETWTNTAGSQENLPINDVNWYEAYAFCIWDGGFLPSEAEWAYAAAGGSQQRLFPWGWTDPGTRNQYAIYGDENGKHYYPTGTLTPNSGRAGIAPVGTTTLGAGLFGQFDLAGNLMEWTLDSFRDAYVAPCADCANLTAATPQMGIAPTRGGMATRGGAFFSSASDLLASHRSSYPDVAHALYNGFRCARAP
jgi:sulfatase modifying factor 1